MTRVTQNTLYCNAISQLYRSFGQRLNSVFALLDIKDDTNLLYVWLHGSTDILLFFVGGVNENMRNAFRHLLIEPRAPACHDYILTRTSIPRLNETKVKQIRIFWNLSVLKYFRLVYYTFKSKKHISPKRRK